MDATGLNAPVAPESAHYVLPRRGWLKLHENRARSLVLFVAGIVAVTAGLLGAERRVSEFQQLDFLAIRAIRGYTVLSVSPRSGAAPGERKSKTNISLATPPGQVFEQPPALRG